jgi:hypothetical protein
MKRSCDWRLLVEELSLADIHKVKLLHSTSSYRGYCCLDGKVQNMF